MGTRAMINIARREEGVSFSEKPDKVMVSIYNHYDGYPEGLGVTLANYLNGKIIVNGLGKDNYRVFNGLGCLAASLIAELKDGPGNIYIEDPKRKHTWIDYEYYVWGDNHKDIWISVFEYGDCIFVGKPDKLLEKYSQTKYED
tara:strand:- start:265 stop:693 length:429 start_codon:yes stop_codon:yes gene_type:complete